MIKIPQSNKIFSITNESDQSGNIWYTKNVSFDEQGYIKLNPRSVAIYSSASDANFGVVASFGRYQTSYQYFLGDAGTLPYKSNLAPTTFATTVDADAGVPTTGSNAGRGVFWQNRWYMSGVDQVYWKNITTGAWTSLGLTLTSNLRIPLCVFRNLNSLCVGNGNTVQLIDTAHGLTRTLTIPADYAVVSISYVNNKVCIVTRLSSASLHQNQEAYVFVWDGSTVSSSVGYATGSDEIKGVVAYKNSFAILTRKGELLSFNGGGFIQFAILPFYINQRFATLGDTIGDIMVVEGEKIYLNTTGQLSAMGIKQQSFLQNYNGGIWCYDPKIGLYHCYSPSSSLVSSITVTSANINITTNVFTSTVGTLPPSGCPVKTISGSPGGLTVGYVYYIIRIDSTHFKLATTRQNAIDGVAIDITSTGSANNYFLALDLIDYGQSLYPFAGGLAISDSLDFTYGKMLMSSELYNAGGSAIDYAQLIVNEFDNIGYAVTPRLSSGAIEDQYQKVFIKYSPLKSNDVITVKCKYENILGLPVSTPQAGGSILWVTPTQFTTTTDFSEAYTYLQTTGNEIECEIINGAGAGQLSKVSSITLDTGIYTINLTDSIEGVAVSNVSNVILDNWKTLGTITSSDLLGYKEFPIEIPTKWVKIKNIVKGTNIIIEETQVINQPQTQSV